MIFSMTGFGRGVAQSKDKRIQIEIKSLNSKQLDLVFRFPSSLKETEVKLRNIVAQRLGRGKIEIWATIENLSETSQVEINTQLLGEYKLQIQELGKKLSLGEPQDWYTLLLRMPDAMKNLSTELTEDDIKALNEAFEDALNNILAFRKDEGKRLEAFFKEKIENISCLLEQVKPYEEERVHKIKERLEERLDKLCSIEYDKGRLEQELIFYIEKLDVTEEKVRLTSHLKYFLETLEMEIPEPSEAQGKKLGFITQEMGREINTLGSKANQAEMQKIVVRMKDELEQIKEQILNIL